MDCKYFGKCGSCTLYEMSYEEQLAFKIKREEERFKEFTTVNFDIERSEPQGFRARAEFRIWRNFDDKDNPTLSFAMSDFEKNTLEIDSCQIVFKNISNLMTELLKAIKNSKTLCAKIYSCEFLSSSIDDNLITLIYHKKLDDIWLEEAKELEKSLNIKIIGRSRKQKVIVSADYIDESLCQ